MKKMCFLFVIVALAACSNKGGQTSQSPQSVTVNMSIVDKGASRWYHGLFWDVETNALATTNRAVVDIDATQEHYTQPLALSLCLREPVSEAHEGENVQILFKPAVYTELHRDSMLTTYKRRYTARVNADARLSTTWYAEFLNNERCSAEHIEFYVTGDTVYSLNCPDMWGFTPEGLSFCFTDKNVKKVTASCRIYYDVYAIKRLGMRTDNWAWVCRLASEEMPLYVDGAGNYTLPKVKGLNLSKADREVMETMKTEAVQGWEDFMGTSMGEAPYIYDFDSYMVTLNVKYHDGTERDYTHLATAMYYEP